MSSPRRIYTVEFKQEAVRMVTHQGLSRAEFAGRLGIGTDLLRKPNCINCGKRSGG